MFKQTNKRSRKPKGQSRDTDNVEHRTKKNHTQHQTTEVNSNAREEAFLIVQIKGFFLRKGLYNSNIIFLNHSVSFHFILNIFYS